MELQPEIKGGIITNLLIPAVNKCGPGLPGKAAQSNLSGLVSQAPIRDDTGTANPNVGHKCGQNVLFRFLLVLFSC